MWSADRPADGKGRDVASDNREAGKRESITAIMARWTVEGWRGRAPLGPIFWVGGAVWFIGIGLERGVVNLFLLPFSPYPLQVSPMLATLLEVCEWILYGIMIWWCIAVWKCAEREGSRFWPLAARGVVIALVVSNIVSALGG